MSTNYVIWMDSQKAHLFALKENGIEKSSVAKHGMDHHTHNKKDHHGDSTSEHFFRDMAEKLHDAEQVLLLGPGLAKNHFKTHLETHHTGHLDKKIVGIENCDHPTDGEVLALARKFFQHYNLYHSPIRVT